MLDSLSLLEPSGEHSKRPIEERAGARKKAATRATAGCFVHDLVEGKAVYVGRKVSRWVDPKTALQEAKYFAQKSVYRVIQDLEVPCVASG